MRRVLFRILLVLVAIVVLAAIVVQIVLSTNVPRNLVLRQLEKQLHLRTETGSLSTGWFGHTTLHDVSFSLPLADHPLLSVQTLQVRHTSLIPLLLGRDFTISHLVLHKPQIRVVRTSDGRWNVEQLAALLGSKKSKPTDTSPPELPGVELIDGSIEVIDGTRQCKVEPVNFKGEPDSAVAWKLDLTIADRLKIAGRLAPGGTWEHEATIELSDVAPWVRPWFALPADFSASARWRARVSSSGLGGRLDAQNVTANRWVVSGGLDISQQEAAIEARPDNLRVTTQLAAVKSVTALSGAIRYEKNLIRAQSLQLSAYGGPATVSGYYDLAARDGELNAGWDKLALPGGILHGGSLTLSLHRPFPSQMVMEGTLFSYGTTPQAPWRARLNFGGQGDTGSNFSWHVNAPELVWNRRTPIRLDGLTLLGTIHRSGSAAPTVTLTSAHFPDAQAMSGTGVYNFADRSWALKLAGNRWPLQLLKTAAIGFDLDATGNSSQVTLNKLSLTQAQTTASLKGAYKFGVPKPVYATVSFTSPPAEQTPDGAAPLVEGSIRGATIVEGTLVPLQLDIGGQLFGRGVRVARRDLGDVSLRLAGEVNPDHATIQTEKLRALGGDWFLRVTYAFDDQLLDADLKVGALPLVALASAAKTQTIGGTLAGEWDAYVLSFPLNARNIRMKGETWIHELSFRGLEADEVHSLMTMENGLLKLDPITLSRGPTGHGSATAQWDIGQPRRVDGSMTFSGWPLASEAGSAVVKLEVPGISIDLPQAKESTPGRALQIAADSIAADIALRTKDQAIGNLTLAGDIGGEVATISDIHGTLLEAPLTGSAVIDLARPLESRGSVQFDKLNTVQLVKLFPAATGLSGILQGRASVGPAMAEHPLEPMAVHLQTTFEGGDFRGLPIGVLNLNAFMNTDRIVLDDRPAHDSTLDIAGGAVRIWGRLGRPAADVLSSQMELRFSDLDLNQITHAANPGAKATPGRLSGNVMLLYNSRADEPMTSTRAPVGPPGTQRVVSPALRKFVETVYGEGKFELRKSDVATIPIFADLYNLMSLGFAPRGPIGSGSCDARLENGTLFISDVRYNNRGIDARVQLSSPRMWEFPYNPVTGTAVGSAQPLTALKLPLVSDIQGALDALQANFTSLLVRGTWRKITTVPIAFANIGKEMKDLLIGDISSSSNAPAGE